LEEDRDRIAVLNIEKRALEQLEPISGGPLTAPTAPQMTDVFPNRCGEPSPFRAGRRSVIVIGLAILAILMKAPKPPVQPVQAQT
jgi:hypothetical protein